MMRIFTALLFCGACATIVCGADLKIGAYPLRVPEGFEVELAAGPPLVDRPIAVARDEQGHLYVTDSAGMSDRADKQLEMKPHRIVRLTDRDGDGRYDESVVFADRMMFPEGCMWRDGSLYVAAPPQIWKLTDADGDGRAEQREVWFDGATLTGCANDLHGPYLGRDGWHYWCKGAFAEQRHTLPNGKPFVTRASHIFRARPDGSGLEPVLTGGMDNPVNVAFLSTGERILSCTFFQHPEAGRRDGLIHAIYGGVYGKRHDPIYEHPMTGDVMPNLVHQGAAAPCGLIAGSEAVFGGGYQDNLFACYFNLHKVVRHTLTADGPTFRTQEEDFLACEHPDFHPTDVFEDADGSLLVVDTGGWYKVCCPTSQLAKPDVLGAIYRIRKKGSPHIDDPLGGKIAWDSLAPEELAELLADQRLFVQRRAAEQLRQTGEPAVAPLRGLLSHSADAAVRQRAVWTLAGMDGVAAREAIRTSLNDQHETVIQAAIHAAGLHRDAKSLDALMKLLEHPNAAVARPAAEALGRMGDARTVAAVLNALGRLATFAPDAAGAPNTDAERIREHALIYALIEIGDAKATAAGLTSSHVGVRRAALVALDQMPEGGLEPEHVLPLLNHEDPILKNTAQWIVSHRPAWGGELVEWFRSRLAQPKFSEDEQSQLASQLAQLAKSPEIQSLIVRTLKDQQREVAQRIALRAMAEAKLTATPAEWRAELAAQLGKLHGANLSQTVATAQALPVAKGGDAVLNQALNEVARRSAAPPDVRIAALAAAQDVDEINEELFTLLVQHLAPREPLQIRTAAATILAKASLSQEQRIALIEALAQVGPLELPKLLPAFERDPTEAQGLKLVAALQSTSGIRGLRVDLLQPLLSKYPPAVQQAGADLLTQLNVSAADQAARLDRLLADLPPGDLRRGHEVFLSQKAACVSCHAVGYLGGRLGPDLTGIAKVRTQRDLLEAIIYPSASFVRSYEPVLVEKEDGQVATGIVVGESAGEIVLAINPQLTLPIAREEIVEIHPHHVSLMPEGFDNLLNVQELADLLEFLKQR